MKKKIYSSRGIHIILMCMLIFLGVGTTPFAKGSECYAAVKSKKVTKTHLIHIPEKPIFITIGVKTIDSYDGTYKDANKTRTFSKHMETLTLCSHNDKYLTSKLKPTIGYLQFYSPHKKTKCNHIGCKCAFYIGSPIFKVKHYCSNTKTTAKVGSNAYCNGGYIITGGSNIIEETSKFSNLAK